MQSVAYIELVYDILLGCSYALKERLLKRKCYYLYRGCEVK